MKAILQEALLDLLDTVHRIHRAQTPAEIVGELRSSAGQYGLSSCLIAQLPAPHAEDWPRHILANGWPAEWFVHYIIKDLYHHDPCAERCRMTTEPFFWRELDRSSMSRQARTIMAEASEFGLRDGLCIPLHIPFSHPALVTFAGQAVDLPPHAALAIHVFALNAIHAVLNIGRPPRRSDLARLSEREREILRWIAAGKTAWEISRILGISAHTVNAHLRNMRRKFETANNAQTVIEAIRRHEIRL